MRAYIFFPLNQFFPSANECFLRITRRRLLLLLLSSVALTFLVLNLRLRSINRGNAKKDVELYFAYFYVRSVEYRISKE